MQSLLQLAQALFLFIGTEAEECYGSAAIFFGPELWKDVYFHRIWSILYL